MALCSVLNEFINNQKPKAPSRLLRISCYMLPIPKCMSLLFSEVNGPRISTKSIFPVIPETIVSLMCEAFVNNTKAILCWDCPGLWNVSVQETTSFSLSSVLVIEVTSAHDGEQCICTIKIEEITFTDIFLLQTASRYKISHNAIPSKAKTLEHAIEIYFYF